MSSPASPANSQHSNEPTVAGNTSDTYDRAPADHTSWSVGDSQGASRKKALLIGIRYGGQSWRGSTSLTSKTGCRDDDIEAWRQHLLCSGYAPQDIRILSDHGYDSSECGKLPTRDNILRELEALIKEIDDHPQQSLLVLAEGLTDYMQHEGCQGVHQGFHDELEPKSGRSGFQSSGALRKHEYIPPPYSIRDTASQHGYQQDLIMSPDINEEFCSMLDDRFLELERNFYSSTCLLAVAANMAQSIPLPTTGGLSIRSLAALSHILLAASELLIVCCLVSTVALYFWIKPSACGERQTLGGSSRTTQSVLRKVSSVTLRAAFCSLVVAVGSGLLPFLNAL